MNSKAAEFVVAKTEKQSTTVEFMRTEFME
jgi:hypothetical protein